MTEGPIQMTDKGWNNSIMCAVRQDIWKGIRPWLSRKVFSFSLKVFFSFTTQTSEWSDSFFEIWGKEQCLLSICFFHSKKCLISFSPWVSLMVSESIRNVGTPKESNMTEKFTINWCLSLCVFAGMKMTQAAPPTVFKMCLISCGNQKIQIF